MRRFILTGAPGAGKTAVLRQLEVAGFAVVEEAATDVIALWQAQGITEPWTRPEFLDAVTELQQQRLQRASHAGDGVQFHDRSVFCTAALASYLGYSASDGLARELEHVCKEAVYEKRAFLIRSLGFMTHTEARRITFDEALRFEKVHEDTYRAFGFDIVFIEPGSVLERAEAIRAAL